MVLRIYLILNDLSRRWDLCPRSPYHACGVSPSRLHRFGGPLHLREHLDDAFALCSMSQRTNFIDLVHQNLRCRLFCSQLASDLLLVTYEAPEIWSPARFCPSFSDDALPPPVKSVASKSPPCSDPWNVHLQTWVRRRAPMPRQPMQSCHTHLWYTDVDLEDVSLFSFHFSTRK